jgi:hypothetical protein
MRCFNGWRTVSLALPILAGFLFASAGVCSAAFVPWSGPNASGSNSFISWSNGGSTDALWGNPIIAGNSFLFTPTDFRAQSSSGIGNPGIVDGLLQFQIETKPGWQISGFSLNESGFYSITGTGAVSAGGQLRIINLANGQEYTDGLDATLPVPGAPNAGFTISNPGPFGHIEGQWAGVMTTTLPNGLQRVLIIVDNNLQAISGGPGPGIPGGNSYIDKKFANGSVVISVFVPEPASICVLLLAGVPLLAQRRRPL